MTELIGILRDSNLQTMLALILGFLLGIVAPGILKAYLRFVEKLFVKKRVWYVQVAGPPGVGKTTLLHRIIGESAVNPGLTLDVIKYRRPVYIRNRLYDIVFSDGLGEHRVVPDFSKRDQISPDGAEISSARVLIFVVAPTTEFETNDRIRNRISTEQFFDAEEAFLKYFSPSFLEVLISSLPRLRKVIVFINKSDLVGSKDREIFERQRDLLLKRLSDFKNLEISVRVGSAATGAGVADLFSEIVAHVQEYSRHDH